MSQWIAILVSLVCLSGSSLSRSWVGFDDFESWQADPDDYGQNRKSRHYSGEDSWESDEDYESGYENVYEHDKRTSSNNGYYKNDGSHAHGYDHHRFGGHHGYGNNHNYGYHGHHTQYGSPGQPDQYWRSIDHHSHGTSSDQPGQNWGSQGHHDQSGSTGQPGQYWKAHGHNTQSANPDKPVQSTGPSQNSPQNDFNRPQGSGNDGDRIPSRSIPQNNVNRPQGTGNDADRIVFPDFNNQASTTSSPTTTRPLTTTARTTTTDPAVQDLVNCIRACPTTPEYNPVCGTNGVTYNNPGALQCARNCGLNVAVARQAPCPRTVPPQTTTARQTTNPTRNTPRPTQATITRTTTFPTVNPTQFINVNVVNNPGSSTIPLEILQSVFGNPSPTNANTEEPEFDIDKRRKP